MPLRLPIAVVLSDVHLGDDHGVLAPDHRTGYQQIGDIWVRTALLELLASIDRMLEKVAAEQGGAPRIPYLVVAGDLWDTAIRNLSDIALLSRSFFEAVELEKRFEQMLFLPGNHDHQIWRMVQTETCVIRPLERIAGRSTQGGDKVFDLPQVANARLDVDGTGGHTLDIQGVRPPYEGHVFTTGLTGGRLPVNVAYPNLYVCRSHGAGTAIVTHGHFLQAAWRLLSDVLGPALAGPIPAMDLFFLELLNAPLTDFVNYSLGQVGPLSSAIDRIYDQIRDGQMPPELDLLLSSLRTVVDRELSFEDEPWPIERIKELATDEVLSLHIHLIRSQLRFSIRNAKGTRALPTGRHESGFLDDAGNRTRIDEYIKLCQRDQPDATFDTFVFGHTHEAVRGRAISFSQGTTMTMWNPGSLASESADCDLLPLVIAADGTIRAFEGGRH